MPVLQEVVHPLSLSFAMQRKVVMRRDVHDESWSDIRLHVRNLKGGRPSKELVRRTYKQFCCKIGHRKFKYGNCGRKAWKVTPEIRAFVVKQLLTLRMGCICTATTLQREVAKKKKVKIATSTVRKILLKAGYEWLPRAQKPKIPARILIQRLAFARRVMNMGPKELQRNLALSMDGVILSTPPKDEVDRANFCTTGDSHMYRKRSEAASPALAGYNAYDKQVPLSRALPMWGGISHGGAAIITFHPTKKIQVEEWVEAVKAGKLTAAIKAGKPLSARGPWRVLCDNEGFMNAVDSHKAHRQQKINLWHVPPRSPDLNPIEKFWSWLRRVLRQKDLVDLTAKRPPLGKMAYRLRVQSVCRSAKAKLVAGNCCKGLRKVCREVVEVKKGGYARS